MQRAIQLTMLALLVGVAIVYFAMPARAAETCRSWTAEMQEDEGGPALVASLLVRDGVGGYPARTYSLQGSAQALATLVGQWVLLIPGAGTLREGERSFPISTPGDDDAQG